MASTPIAGYVKGFSALSGGSPAAFCRRLTAGSFKITSHDTTTEGINALTDTIKGVEEMDVSVTCYGVSKTDLLNWFPTTVIVSQTGMPDFCLAGSWGGYAYDWLLEGCEPVSASVKAEGTGLVTCELAFKAIATRKAAATYTPVYNTNVCHQMRHVTATIGGAAQGLVGFTIGSTLGTEMEVTGDGGTPGYMWKPDGFLIGSQKSNCSTTTRNPFALADLNVTTVTLRDLVFTLDNGENSEDMTFTLEDWAHDGSFDIPFNASGIDGYQNTWIPGPGNSYGRVVLT